GWVSTHTKYGASKPQFQSLQRINFYVRAKQKGRSQGAALPIRFWSNPRLTRVEFDDQVWFHLNRIGHVRQGRDAGIGRGHLVVVDFHIVRNVTLGELDGFENHGELLGALADLDLVANLDLVGRDIDALAIDQDVAVRHELTRSEHGRHELGAVNDRVQTALEQADQVLAGVALNAGS